MIWGRKVDVTHRTCGPETQVDVICKAFHKFAAWIYAVTGCFRQTLALSSIAADEVACGIANLKQKQDLYIICTYSMHI